MRMSQAYRPEVPSALRTMSVIAISLRRTLLTSARAHIFLSLLRLSARDRILARLNLQGLAAVFTGTRRSKSIHTALKGVALPSK